MAHRGSSGSRPENTILAFEQAVLEGADILELDVHMSLDGEPVVIHDPTVDRTTNGVGAVKKMPYRELLKLDAGYRFSKDSGLSFPYRGAGAYLPRFKDMLEAFPCKPMNVEIKDPNPLLARKMAGLLYKHDRMHDVLIGAESLRLMQYYRKIAPEAITGHSLAEAYRFVACAWLGLDFIYTRPRANAVQLPVQKFGFRIPGPSVIARAKELGLEVHVWTVNDRALMRDLLKQGVDGIFTDHPALMKSLLDSGELA